MWSQAHFNRAHGSLLKFKHLTGVLWWDQLDHVVLKLVWKWCKRFSRFYYVSCGMQQPVSYTFLFFCGVCKLTLIRRCMYDILSTIIIYLKTEKNLKFLFIYFALVVKAPCDYPPHCCWYNDALQWDLLNTSMWFQSWTGESGFEY